MALLKTLFDRGGMYGRDKDLGWKKLKDIVYFAAMGTIGGGRHTVDPRILAHFAIFNVLTPNDDTIIYIYQSILKGHLADFETELLPLADRLVTSTIKLFNVNAYNTFFVVAQFSIDYQYLKKQIKKKLWCGHKQANDAVLCDPASL